MSDNKDLKSKILLMRQKILVKLLMNLMKKMTMKSL